MRSIAILMSAVATATLSAQAFPLPASAVPGSTNATEGTAPFLIPSRMTQTKITDRNTLTGQGLPATFGLWDMPAFDPSSRYIFVPSEVTLGCGLFRYDRLTNTHVNIMVGNGSGVRTATPATWNPANDEFQRFDPATFTPWGTVLTGEETTGGRLFEVMNPLSNGPFTIVWRSNIPAVAHEGLRTDDQHNLYFVDEDNSGCVYKFVPGGPANDPLSVGQTFVLSVDAFFNDPNAFSSQTWNSPANRLTTRVGQASWLPLTDAAGMALTVANPFTFVATTGGRTAADEIKGTPFGRPEDADLNTLANGRQALYFAATSENTIYSIELVSSTTAIVRAFVDFDTINLATGSDVNPLQNDPFTNPGTGTVLASPDNIAVDAFGSVYIIEDGEPNGGDIWKAIDADRDGVAESVGLFASLGISGSEPSGLTFDPNDPYLCIVNVQHPGSGNDALWSLRTNPYRGSDQLFDLQLRVGVDRTASHGPAEHVHDAHGGQLGLMHILSPNGSMALRPYVLGLQGFGTAFGPAPILPRLWLNIFEPVLVVSGGLVGPFVSALPNAGAQVALGVPPGFLGTSIMVQGVGVAADGTLVLTSGHEAILH